MLPKAFIGISVQVVWRKNTGRVSRMYTRIFYMLHDAAYQHIGAVERNARAGARTQRQQAAQEPGAVLCGDVRLQRVIPEHRRPI